MVAEGNVGLAFGLVAAAGMCTTLGAAFVFFADTCRPRLLAGSLAFAAGVMLYVSFVEIFAVKSVGAFIEDGSSDAAAQRWATFCFFGGIIVVYILDGFVHLITNLATWLRKQELNKLKQSMSMTSFKSLINRKQKAANSAAPASETPASADGDASTADVETGPSAEPAPAVVKPCAAPCATGCCPMEQVANQVAAALAQQFPPPTDSAVSATTQEGDSAEVPRNDSTLPVPRDPDVIHILQSDQHTHMLKKMGLLTALAIFIHNFPEGLATFVATLADASVGATIAIAIAIHNIPEGICVALPIYYATGSKWKGFFWAFVSGLSEPIGGLFGYFILYDPNPLSYAIVFGIVGGMMVCISLKELLPTAIKFEPKTSFVLAFLFLGMVVMAASLILFAL